MIGPGDVPLTSKEIRNRLRELPSARVPLDVSTYRDELRHRLGPLGVSFHRLIVRAAAFRPIGQVRQFVFDYLLDERSVNTEALQANLENYKRLEEEARQARRRIASLDDILAQGSRLAAEQRTAEVHRFLSIRAGVEVTESRVTELGAAIEAAEQRARQLETEKGLLEEAQRQLTERRESVLAVLLGLPAHAELKSLEKERDRLCEELERAQRADKEARQILALQLEALGLLSSEESRAVRRERASLLAADEVTGVADPTGLTARLRETLAHEGSLTGRHTASWTRRLDQSISSLNVLKHVANEEIETLKAEGKDLQEERQSLQQGRHRYPEGVEALLHLLRARLKTQRDPRPLCELIDVRNDRWRDAVEGYLNTRRFDVIVASEDFPRALQLYERNKAGYSLPGRPAPVFIASVGLVDMERVYAHEQPHQLRSLAAQVDTEDALARAYCDYLMGDVICVDSEQDLRRHSRSITDTVMVYQGHVARQTERRVYERHYLGASARVRRLEEIDARLAVLSARLITLANQVTWLESARKKCQQAAASVGRLAGLVDDAGHIDNHRRAIARIDKQLESIDRSEIEKLDLQKKEMDTQLKELTDQLTAKSESIGEAKNEKRTKSQELETATASSIRAAELLATAFGETSETERGQMESRYQLERQTRSAGDIQAVFEKQHKGLETKLANLTNELVRKKTTFANDYGFNGDPEPAAVGDHERERDLWRDSKLVEYEQSIGHAKNEAIEQLAEDIIFKLRDNLMSVQRHFDELNRSLKDVTFGSDRYSFVKEVALEHREFHDLIMDAGRFEKASLFGSPETLGSTRKTLEDLWDRLLQSEAQQVKSDLEAKADYRQYFDYDLKIHHADGHISFFDRVSGDKSGGETQTPFYIAILASMSRLYRHASGELNPSCGVVLLDEAFSKMDEKHIAGVLELSRSLKLQLLLATPKERSELVAPHVETSLYIHKDAMSGVPTVLDFTKEFHADAVGAGTARTAQTTARGA